MKSLQYPAAFDVSESMTKLTLVTSHVSSSTAREATTIETAGSASCNLSKRLRPCI